MKLMRAIQRFFWGKIRILVDRVYDHCGDLILEKHRQAVEQATKLQNGRLLEKIQGCGVDVQINGRIHVTYPGGLLLGHGVTLEEDVWLETDGGVIIGDQSLVSRRVVVNSVSDHPVVIGRNVRIGMNTYIGPGVRIGDGVVIGPGERVTEDIPGSADCGGEATLKPLQRPSRSPADRMFFIVSTGRSGTTSAASMLSQHPQIECIHERRLQLVRASTAYTHGRIGLTDLKRHLEDIYLRYCVLPPGCYGEANQKFFNMIEVLDELMPESLFVWLIRDGREVVASTFKRGWYCDDELSRFENNAVIRRYWRDHRIQGHLADNIPEKEWTLMSPFEKNCWYWGYVNRRIRQQLSRLPSERWRLVKLEHLRDQLDEMCVFLGVSPYSFSDLVKNASSGIPYQSLQWTVEEHQAFERHCGEIMDAVYPAWRKD